MTELHLQINNQYNWYHYCDIHETIIGAIIAGGLGIILFNTSQEASTALTTQLGEMEEK